MVIESIPPDTGDLADKLALLPTRKEFHTEYEKVLGSPEYEVNPHTDGVVVLSAYEFTGTPQDFDPEDPKNGENIDRITVGNNVRKEVVAASLGKSMDELTEDDMAGAPPLILNGTTQQLPFMQAIASGMNISERQVISLDCGTVGQANTKTQIAAVNEYIEGLPTKPRNLAFVTSAYHVPRTGRTIDANLDGETQFNLAHVPAKDGDQARVWDEIPRIVKYGLMKDDITLRPPRPGTRQRSA